MAGKASVVFNADTGQYIASVQGMDAATAKAADTVAAAKNKVLESFKAQERELKTLGASTEDYAKASTNASNALASITEKNAEKQIAALDRVYAKQKSLKAELATLGSVSDAPDVSHDITSRQKTAALVRAGSGSPGIRAAESFANTLPGFAGFADVAFPIVGAVAFTVEVVKGVTALKDMYDEAQHVSEEIGSGWSAITAPIENSTDALRKANDELRIANDRLEHRDSSKSQLALEMDEIRLAVDKVAESAGKADVEVRKLFAEKSVGFMQSLFSGQVGTAPVEKDIQDRLDAIKDAQDDNRTLTRTNPGDAAGRKKREDAIRAQYEDLYKTADTSVDALKDVNGNGHYNSIIAEYRGARAYAGDALDQMAAEKDNQTETARNKNDQAARDRQREAQEAERARQEAVRKAEEAQRKAAEAQRKRFSEQFSDAELNNPDFNKAGAYLLRKDQQQTALPANRVEAERATAQAYKDFLRQNAEEVKQINETTQKAQRESWEKDYGDWQAAAPRTAQAEADYWSIRMLEADQGSANYLEAERKANEALKRVRDEASRAADARNKAGVQQAGNTARYAEATIALEEQTGALSRYDAAVQLASVNTQRYAAEISALRLEYIKQQDLDPNSAATVNAKAALDKAETDRAIQVQRDAANEVGETWKGALNNANAEWVQNATDSAAQVKQLYTQAIDGFNENAADALTGQKTNWTGYARGLGKTVATDGLKRAEAPLLGALGMTKADGSQASPFYVRLADDVAKGFGKLFGHGDADSADSGSGSNSGFGTAIGQGLSGIAKLFSGSGAGGGADTGTVNDTGAPVGDPTSTEVGSALDQGLGMAVQGFAGGFALGGDVSPGKTITVGEMGPEQLTLGPGSAAHVTPNKDLASGPAPVMYHVSVANGVTPEEFDMRMRSALEAYHPHAVKASVQAVHDAQRRAPASAR